MRGLVPFVTVTVALLLGNVVPASGDLTVSPRENVPNINSSLNDVVPSIFSSPDSRTETLVFSRSGGRGFHDLWKSTRAVPHEEWSRAVPLEGPVNSQYYEDGPHITSDGLSLYFTDGLWFADPPHRPDGFGGGDIWLATRETTDDDFGVPVNLGETVNTRYYDGGAGVSEDGLSLLFNSSRPGGEGRNDLWMTQYDQTDSAWTEPFNLGATVNSTAHDIHPTLSSDGLRLLFASNRSGDYDIWTTTRDTLNDEWRTPVQLGEEVNTPLHEAGASLSHDGSTLYITATSSSSLNFGWDIYRSEVIFKSCDFNRDDVCSLLDLSTSDGLYSVGDLTIGVSVSDREMFDLNGDGTINGVDLGQWLAAAAAENGVQTPYLKGDANLDGAVQFTDFRQLASSFPGGRQWSEGNFDGSGDGTQFPDFLMLADNFGMSPIAVAVVPEPAGLVLAMLVMVGALDMYRNRSSQGAGSIREIRITS